MPDAPARSASKNARAPTPKVDTQPMPVINTRSRIGPATVPWGSDMVNELWRRIGSPVLVALAIAAAFAGVVIAAADPFAELYKRGMAKQREMHSISARFTETT